MATTVSSSNQGTSINSITGGSVRVTIPVTPFQITGNDGTSLPCKTCYLTAPVGNTGVVKMNIDAKATSVLGLDLVEVKLPFEMPIDDVDKLNFYSGTQGDIIDILYRT